PPQTLIEHWDGSSWSIVPSPNTSTSQPNLLRGVACTSASDCWAVGEYNLVSSGPNNALIEHWDGSSWSIVAPPNTNASQDELWGVTCASESECWAVGDYNVTTGSNFQTLIEHWDGTSWSVVTSANISADEANHLYSVTCTSASDCWTVGVYEPG